MYEYEFSTKTEMLNKLRNYSLTPDDDNIILKNRIRDELLHCPELLYALHDTTLENELFDSKGNLKVDGEWDAYYGDHSHIRPYLFIPDTQTEVNNYICYQTNFSSLPRYNNAEKEFIIVFNIFVHGKDRVDSLTGLARHDLIASIIREKISWSGITYSSAIPVSDKEGVTDNNYITRTLQFQATIPNSLVKTDHGITQYTNKWK